MNDGLQHEGIFPKHSKQFIAWITSCFIVS